MSPFLWAQHSPITRVTQAAALRYPDSAATAQACAKQLFGAQAVAVSLVHCPADADPALEPAYFTGKEKGRDKPADHGPWGLFLCGNWKGLQVRRREGTGQR